MAVKYIPDGEDFDHSHFSKDFGFSGSSRQPKGYAEGGAVQEGDESERPMDRDHGEEHARGGAIKPKMPRPVNTASPDYQAGVAAGLKHGARIGAQAAATHLLGGSKGPAAAGAPPIPGGAPMGAGPVPDVGGGAPIPGSPPPQGALGMADGGTVEFEGEDYAKGGKFIQHAIKHPGALHRNLGVPEGQKIPAAKLEAATHSSDPTVRRRANLAETMKGFNHKRKD